MLESALESTEIASAHEGIASSIRLAEEGHRRYMARLRHMDAMPVPPDGAELRQVHLEGLAVAQLHTELAASSALESSPALRRVCLQRALAAVPPAPIGSKALAETLYSLGWLPPATARHRSQGGALLAMRRRGRGARAKRGVRWDFGEAEPVRRSHAHQR